MPLRQKPTKTITSAYTTSDADNGYRIICNSAAGFEVTLHSAAGRYNFELEIINIGAGTVTVDSQAVIQYSHVHIGNNGGASWAVAIGHGLMTKAQIENVLTGVISSHSHADNVLSGSSAPTTATAGTLGQLYVETATPALYVCTKETSPYSWLEASGSSGGEGGGASTFLELTDTPSSYAGQSGKMVIVNSAGSGLTFEDVPEGSGGTAVKTIWGGM